MKIFKYPLTLPNNIIRMPLNAHVLCVQMQRGYPTLWATVDPDNGTHERTFNFFGTGHELPDDIYKHVYIDTVQFEDGTVWHCFEEV